MSDWTAAAEAAIEGAPPEGSEVVPVHRPPVFDAAGMTALSTPLLAAAAWAAVLFRAGMDPSPLDPIGLLARLVALALTVRTVFALGELVGRIRVWIAKDRYALVLTDAGLLLRTPRARRAIEKDDVLDVRERGDWRERKGTRRWSPVYLVVRPTSQGVDVYVALPPLFERNPGVLAEHLMRWRGPHAPADAKPDRPEPHRLASKVYDRAASGAPIPGATVVRHGRGWLRRGPYASLLLAVVLLDALARTPEGTFFATGGVFLVGLSLALLLVPLAWIAFSLRHVAPRKGIAFVMTEAEILMRTRAGILRATWHRLGRVHVEVKRGWSLVEGFHESRRLVLERADQPEIRYDEAFLGVPAEVVVGLCEAYKRGALP